MISIRTIYREAWSLFKINWRVFVTSMILVAGLSLVQQLWISSGTFTYALFALIIAIICFVTVTFHMVYILAITSGRHSDWRSAWGRVTPQLVWRFFRAQVWSGVMILWPALAIMVPLVLVSSLTTTRGTGIMALFIALFILGGIASFVITLLRALLYGIVPYLVFTTDAGVRALSQRSRVLMMGYRKKFLILILVQFVLSVISALTYHVGTLVLFPINVIAFVLFAGMVVAAQHSTVSDATPAPSTAAPVLPVTDTVQSEQADPIPMTGDTANDDTTDTQATTTDIEPALDELPQHATPESEMSDSQKAGK